MRKSLPIMFAALLAGAPPAQGEGRGRPPVIVRPSPSAAPAPPPAPGTAQTPVVPDRFARARDNLAALREGRRAVGDLSDQELQDVIDFNRLVRRSAPATGSPRQECVDAEARGAGGLPSWLAWQVIALKCR